jgi:hypothetical protein
MHALMGDDVHGMEQEFRVQGSVAKLLLSMPSVGVSVSDPSSSAQSGLYST